MKHTWALEESTWIYHSEIWHMQRLSSVHLTRTGWAIVLMAQVVCPGFCAIHMMVKPVLSTLLPSGLSQGLLHFNLQNTDSLSQLDFMCVQGLLSVIRQKAGKLSDAHESSKTITKSTQMKSLRQKMQDDAAEVTTLANQAKNRLEALDKQNEQSLNRKACPSLCLNLAMPLKLNVWSELDSS